MNPFLHLLVSLCVSVCRSVCPAQPAPSILPHTPGLSLPRAPSVSSWLQDRGEKKEIWSLAPWGPAQKCVWGGWSARPTGRLTPPLPLPAAPGRRGPAALVSEIFEQHLGGHILQVGPSLPAAPCCHLVAASGNSTLFSSIHPIGSPGTGGPNPGAPPPTWPSRGPPKTLLPHPQSNPS